jgi:hypothetical protein
MDISHLSGRHAIDNHGDQEHPIFHWLASLNNHIREEMEGVQVMLTPGEYATSIGS